MAPEKECPHCEVWFKPNAYARHVPVCERKPSDDELIQMRLDGLSLQVIADSLEVAHATVAKWARACGADKIKVKAKFKRVVTVFPGKALRYGQRGGCDGCEEDIGLC